MRPLLASLLALACMPAPACDMFAYERVQASPHVLVFQAAEGTTAVVNGNIVAVIGAKAVLVFDTGQIPSVARKVLAEIRARSAAPIRYIVNSHWHGDHLLANHVVREAFPEVRVIAHSHTAEQAARVYTDYAARTAERLPKIVADMRKQREASASAQERAYLDATLACVEMLRPEVPGTHLVAPDIVVDGALSVDLGGVTAKVMHLGSGNTPGDLVLWVQEDRLVATGDMVVYPAPYAIGAELAPWIPTLEKLRGLGAAVIVPGHGPPMRDERYVRDLEALLAGTQRQLGEMRARGLSRAEAVEQLDTADFAARYLDTPMRRQAFREFFVDAAVRKAWPAAPPTAP